MTNNIDLSYLSTQASKHSQTSSLASTCYPKTFFAKHTKETFEESVQAQRKKRQEYSRDWWSTLWSLWRWVSIGLGGKDLWPVYYVSCSQSKVHIVTVLNGSNLIIGNSSMMDMWNCRYSEDREKEPKKSITNNST